MLSLRLVKISKSSKGLMKECLTFVLSENKKIKVEVSVQPGSELGGYDSFYSSFISHIKMISFSVKGSCYIFCHNHLHDNYGRVYYQNDVNYVPALKKIRTSNRDILKLTGSCAYLSNTEPQHYGHFIMFVLPLISLYEKSFNDKPDYYYVGDFELSDNHFKLLGLAGVPKNKIVNRPCSADVIYYISATRYSRLNKKYWDFDSYQYIKNITEPLIFDRIDSLKIYVQRGNVKWRRLVNESEVISYLKSRGFLIVCMDGLSLEDQVKIFSQASHIVSVHGAAMTNLIFCHPSTTVVEIFPSDYPDTTSFVFSTYSGCKYTRLEGSKYDLSKEACYRDVYLDISKLKSLYD